MNTATATRPHTDGRCSAAALADGTDAPGHWRVDAHTAVTLRPVPRRRWLRVDAGRAWITALAPSADGTPPADVWLDAGGALELPRGSGWVVEVWPGARLVVVEDATALAPAGRRRATPSRDTAAVCGSLAAGAA